MLVEGKGCLMHTRIGGNGRRAIIALLILYDSSATKDSVQPKTNNYLGDFRKERKKFTESKRSEASADDLFPPKLRKCGSL
jgi:hypothetical protein